jgi:hypothetical protein
MKDDNREYSQMFLSLAEECVKKARRVTADNRVVYSPMTTDFYGPYTFLRDYVYMSSPLLGFVPNDEMKDSLSVFLNCVREDGAVYRAYNYKEMQVDRWSVGEPDLDGPMFLVQGFYNYFKSSGDIGLFFKNRKTIYDAIRWVPADQETGLVWIRPGQSQVSYGFTDTVYKPGRELFCSLLLMQAYRFIGEMEFACGCDQFAQKAIIMAESIRANLYHLWNDKGYFIAYDRGNNPPPDLWGTAFAVYCGAVDECMHKKIADWIISLYETHDTSQRGYTFCNGFARHLPAPYFWEYKLVPPATEHFYYQDGWYWSMPTGWLAYALQKYYPESASRLMGEMIKWILKNGVWEAIYLNGECRGNGNISSVVCPAEVLSDCHIF